MEYRNDLLKNIYRKKWKCKNEAISLTLHVQKKHQQIPALGKEEANEAKNRLKK